MSFPANIQYAFIIFARSSHSKHDFKNVNDSIIYEYVNQKY